LETYTCCGLELSADVGMRCLIYVPRPARSDTGRKKNNMIRLRRLLLPSSLVPSSSCSSSGGPAAAHAALLPSGPQGRRSSPLRLAPYPPLLARHPGAGLPTPGGGSSLAALPGGRPQQEEQQGGGRSRSSRLKQGARAVLRPLAVLQLLLVLLMGAVGAAASVGRRWAGSSWRN